MEKFNRNTSEIEKLEIPLDDIPGWILALRDADPSRKFSLREIDGMLARVSPEYVKLGDGAARLKIISKLEQFLRDTNVEKMSEKEKEHNRDLLKMLREELHDAIQAFDKGKKQEHRGD